MATTFIYKIKVTGEKSIDYDKSDKIADIIKRENDSFNSLNYITRDKTGNIYKLSADYMEKMKDFIVYKDDKIIFKTVSSSLNCSLLNTHEEWETVRRYKNPSNGNEGILQYCIAQNFGEDISPLLANEIGMRFAEEYLNDYQCIVSTHINTGLVHNHIEFNATSYINGRKFDDNLQAIRDIRKVSDKICKEYGLDVLEATKDFRIIKFKDQNGNVKFYEPTERKNKMVEGEYANRNDYRNTEQYKLWEENKTAHYKVLKKDIDNMIPLVFSYEELLHQLGNLGYDIKEKTKKGEWRKHISFKAPDWEDYVRDSRLGGEYTRINLVKRFDGERVQRYYSLPGYMDREYSYKKMQGGYERRERSEIEKYIIDDVVMMNNKIEAIKQKSIHPDAEDSQKLGRTKREQYLIERINGNLKTLRFIEEKEISSFNHFSRLVATLVDKRDKCENRLKLIEAALSKIHTDLALIEKYKKLKEALGQNTGNAEYDLYEKDNDSKVLELIEKELIKKKISDNEAQENIQQKYSSYYRKYKTLSAALELVNRNIKQFDECIYNIKTVDKKNGSKYLHEIENYYSMRYGYLESSGKKVYEDRLR